MDEFQAENSPPEDGDAGGRAEDGTAGDGRNDSAAGTAPSQDSYWRQPHVDPPQARKAGYSWPSPSGPPDRPRRLPK